MKLYLKLGDPLEHAHSAVQHLCLPRSLYTSTYSSANAYRGDNAYGCNSRDTAHFPRLQFMETFLTRNLAGILFGSPIRI